MSFGIFFNPTDLQAMASGVNLGTLPQALRQTAQKYWNGGLKNWQSAPAAAAQYQEGDAEMRVVTVSGANLTLAVFLQLLRDIAAAAPSLWYLRTISEEGESAFKEPWP